MSRSTSWWDRFFEDRHGNLAIFQKPTKLLILALISSFIALMTIEGLGHRLFTIIAFTAWIIWALRELYKGASYFRRCIGGLLLILMILLIWW